MPATAGGKARARQQYGGDLHVVLKVFSGYGDDPTQPDSWHQYGPAKAYSEHRPHSATVSPGVWHRRESTPRLTRDLGRFRADVQRMADSGAFSQLVTTWNEWGEGTSVEPAEEWGTTYLDVLTDFLGGPGPDGPRGVPAGPVRGMAGTGAHRTLRHARPDRYRREPASLRSGSSQGSAEPRTPAVSVDHMPGVPCRSFDLPIRLRPACGHDGTWSVAELALVIRQGSMVGVRHRCVSCARDMITRLPSPTHARILSSLGVEWVSEADVLVERA